jgi:hypothetical protein
MYYWIVYNVPNVSVTYLVKNSVELLGIDTLFPCVYIICIGIH